MSSSLSGVEQSIRALLRYNGISTVIVMAQREVVVAELAAMESDKSVRWIAVSFSESVRSAADRAGWTSVEFPARYGTYQAQIEFAVIKAVSEGLLGLTERAIVLTDGNRSKESVSTFQIVVPQDDVPIVGMVGKVGGLSTTTVETVWAALDLSVELGSVRHSQVSGTLMTIGDAEKVLAISKGFLFEPFGWYPRSSRNISDPTIRKTIEKYTRLDGAFIISEDGTIERLVQTITAPVASENLAVGLGSRHSAAAAISLFTEAVTIVVSQSGGNVSVFADGRSILSLKSS